METAAIIFGLLGTVAWIVSGFVLHGDHRIWAGVVAVEFYVLAFGCTYQQSVWNKATNPSQSPAITQTDPTEPSDAKASTDAEPPNTEKAALGADIERITRAVEGIPGQPRLLVPGDENPSDDGRDGSETSLDLHLGSNVWSTSSFPWLVDLGDGEPILTVGKSGNRAWVSISLFDKDGKVLCKIDQNRVVINRNKVFDVRYPTPYTIEIFNDEDRVVFRVEYLDTRTMRMWGDFYTRSGKHVLIDDTSTSVNGVKLSKSLFIKKWPRLPADAPDRPRLQKFQILGKYPPDGEAAKGALVIFNDGKKRGTISRLAMHMLFGVPVEQSEHIKKAIEAAQADAGTVHHAVVESNSPASITFPLNRLDAETTASIVDATQPLFCAGRFTYSGEGTPKYTTRFCFKLEKGGQWVEFGGAEFNGGD